eukprot:scaffold171921_cov39-Tisochrysis_lutea.AAC.1
MYSFIRAPASSIALPSALCSAGELDEEALGRVDRPPPVVQRRERISYRRGRAEPRATSVESRELCRELRGTNGAPSVVLFTRAADRR